MLPAIITRGTGMGMLPGLLMGYLYGSGSGNYLVGTYGNWEEGVGNLILNQAVHIRVLRPQRGRSSQNIHRPSKYIR